MEQINETPADEDRGSEAAMQAALAVNCSTSELEDTQEPETDTAANTVAITTSDHAAGVREFLDVMIGELPAEASPWHSKLRNHIPKMLEQIDDVPDAYRQTAVYTSTCSFIPSDGSDFWDREHKCQVSAGTLRHLNRLVHKVHLVMLDDIGTKYPAPDLQPTAKVMSSKGNEQWLYKLKKPIDFKDAEDFMVRMKLNPQADPGAMTAARKVRLPWGINGKPDDEGTIDTYPVHLTHWDPDTTFTLNQLIDEWELPVATEKAVRKMRAKTGASMKGEGRNVELTRIGGAMRGRGLEFEEIYEELLKVNSSMKDPLDKGEVETVADSCSKMSPTPATKSGGRQQTGTSQKGTGDIDKLKSDSLRSLELAEMVRSALTWDAVSEEWYRYGDGHWAPMTSAQMMRELSNFLDGAIPKGYSFTTLRTMTNFLKIRLVNEKWGSAKGMLPMRNGVLDLKTMKLLPHSPDYKFQWVLPYAYDAKADCPTIKTYLLDATEGDAEAVESIRAALFFTLLFHLGTQKFMEILGPGGTGKSALVRLIQELIGKDNCVTTDLKNLEGNKFETAGLYGKRAAFINDSSRYSGEVSQLKAISGEDPIRFEKKGKQQDESFLAECFVYIVSNEPIQSADYSSGLSRRRVPINFVKQITDADREKWKAQGGIEKVMKQELPGMLNWVISMGKDAALASLGGINGRMNKAQLKHLLQTNALAAWVEENCVLIPGAKTYTGRAPRAGDSPEDIEEYAATKLYSNYRQWCQGTGYKPLSMQRYGQMLEELLINMLKLPVEWLEKDVGGRSFSGISIRNNNNKDIPTPILKEILS